LPLDSDQFARVRSDYGYERKSVGDSECVESREPPLHANPFNEAVQCTGNAKTFRVTKG